MSRLTIMTQTQSQRVIEELYKDLERRIIASPPGLCPVDMAAAFLRLCHAQTCGKCVPCRIGLAQLQVLIESVLDGNATLKTIQKIEKLAKNISDSADCAIGYEAANMVLKGIHGFRDDYEEHILHGRCTCSLDQPVPCVSMCPAGVDIPGYLALIAEGHNADAVRLIRKDNPFPAACAFICEHPCEARCRRNMLDDSINIRGLKRYAVDQAGFVPAQICATKTGKQIAIVGGGPGGLSAAYYLQLMGHQCVVYEKRKQLGGMLRYGIPNYRLPRTRLDEEIEVILSTGVKTYTGVDIGRDITMRELSEKYDAIYLAIGAQTDKKVGIPGEEGVNVISAVEMLRNIGDEHMPDFQNQRVVVIGGGNVAMDVARSAKRANAAYVGIAYRRRKEDMTALPEEVEGALAEGCELLTLQAPISIELDEQQRVTALWVQPQIISMQDRHGRPSPKQASMQAKRIPCDVVIVAIGQGIESKHFADEGVPICHGAIDAMDHSGVENMDGIFAGGDCVTGPASVIRAIAAGKVAAANIDEYLGYNHTIACDVKIPEANFADRPRCGRVQLGERETTSRANDFDPIEFGMSCEEAKQEASRCLRCDHFGFGVFKGGRITKW